MLYRNINHSNLLREVGIHPQGTWRQVKKLNYKFRIILQIIGPDGFTGEFYQILKKNNTNSLQTLTEIKEEETLHSFYEASTTSQGHQKKRKLQNIALVNTDVL